MSFVQENTKEIDRVTILLDNHDKLKEMTKSLYRFVWRRYKYAYKSKSCPKRECL